MLKVGTLSLPDNAHSPHKVDKKRRELGLFRVPLTAWSHVDFVLSDDHRMELCVRYQAARPCRDFRRMVQIVAWNDAGRCRNTVSSCIGGASRK
jgi:hypothetical protein